MAGLSSAGRAVMMTAWAGEAVYFSLHDADPGDTGANELSGGSPAYARQAGAWDDPAGTELVQDGEVVFDVPPDSDVEYWGAWSAASGGTFYGSGPLDEPESYNGQGQFRLAGARLVLT